MMKLFFLAIAASMFVDITVAQQRKIIGRVVDAETQKPMKNVNVIIKGTTSGSFSNQLGFFEITVKDSEHKAIIASHVGYVTSEIAIPAQERFKFDLKKNFSRLDNIDLGFYPVDISTIPVNNPSNPTETNSGFQVVEYLASPPEGMGRFYAYLGNALVKSIEGTTVTALGVDFTIDELGKATKIRTSDSTNLLTASIREALLNMPEWIPAQQRGNKISQSFTLGIIPAMSKVEKQLNTLLTQSIGYPPEAHRNGVTGQVDIELVLENNGSEMTATVLRDPGFGCGDEAKKGVLRLSRTLMEDLVKTTKTNRFLLPVLFSTESIVTKYSPPQTSTYILNEVNIVAIGQEREVQVTGTRAGNAIARMQQQSTIDARAYVGRRWTSFDEAKKHPNHVLTLDVRQSNLSKIPEEVKQFKNLASLDLGENQIENLPESIIELKKLDGIGLASNRFTQFPAVLLKMTKLTMIDLSNNQLTSIPDEISALQNLKILVIRKNNIHSILPQVLTLKKLSYLAIQGNPIPTEEIEQLKRERKDLKIIF